MVAVVKKDWTMPEAPNCEKCGKQCIPKCYVSRYKPQWNNPYLYFLCIDCDWVDNKKISFPFEFPVKEDFKELGFNIDEDGD